MRDFFCRGVIFQFLYFGIVALTHGHLIMDEGTSVPSDEAGVVEKSLIEHFSQDVEIQVGGTCAIHSSAALLEAFCSKHAGVDLDISESFQTYRHISDRLKDGQGNPLVDPFNLFSADNNGLERGNPKETLDRIKLGNVCTASEFVPEKESHFASRLRTKMVTFRKAMVAEAAKAARLAGKEFAGDDADKIKLVAKKVAAEHIERFKRELGSGLDADAALALQIPRYEGSDLPGHGVKTKTRDPGLQACLAKIKTVVQKDNPSPTLIKEWLETEKPLICVIYAAENISTVFEEPQQYSDKYAFGAHAFVIYGYRHSTRSRRNEFFVRDSNLTKVPGYSVTGCDYVVGLEPTT